MSGAVYEEALHAARVVFNSVDGATAPALWAAAQQLLQTVLGRPELTGQALIGEVRRVGLITLSDAHALVALQTWADRATTPAANEAERMIVREAWMALDHAGSSPWPPAPPAASSPFAAPDSRVTAAPDRTVSRDRQADGPDVPGSATASGPVPSSHRRRLYLGLAGLVTLLVMIAGGAWWYGSGRADRLYDDGVAAYQRGAREVARAAFVQAAQLDPDDARPLIYLGRITREEGDLSRARRFLTSAVRLAPTSSVAARELASLMLADNQPEIARRFYVRAIELDPTDRAAQGFLGCTLFRLQRYDEARRWSERAGPGDWQRCIPPMPMPMPVGAPPLPPA